VKTLTVDDRQRVRLPQVKAGQVFAYEPNADGSIRLVPVVPAPEPRTVTAKLVRKRGRLVFELPKGLTLAPDAIARAVREERDSR
jgi:hypothetical protein